MDVIHTVKAEKLMGMQLTTTGLWSVTSND